MGTVVEKLFDKKCDVFGFEKSVASWGEAIVEKKLLHEQVRCRLVGQGWQFEDGMVIAQKEVAVLLYPKAVCISEGCLLAIDGGEYFAIGIEKIFTSHREIKVCKNVRL